MTRTFEIPEELRKPAAELASAWQKGMALSLAGQLNEQLGIPLRYAIQIEIGILVGWAARIGAIGAIIVEGREPDRELWLQACGEDFDREVAYIRAQKAAEAADAGLASNDQVNELERLVDLIRKHIADLPKIPSFQDREAWATRSCAVEQIFIDLAQAEDARVRNDTHSASIRLAKISSSSTAGIVGALQNWIKAAEKKIEQIKAGAA